jgi:chromosome segregation ATPase
MSINPNVNVNDHERLPGGRYFSDEERRELARQARQGRQLQPLAEQHHRRHEELLVAKVSSYFQQFMAINAQIQQLIGELMDGVGEVEGIARLKECNITLQQENGQLIAVEQRLQTHLQETQAELGVTQRKRQELQQMIQAMVQKVQSNAEMKEQWHHLVEGYAHMALSGGNSYQSRGPVGPQPMNHGRY